MENGTTLTLESDWLPGAELRRLVNESHPEFPTLSVASDDDLLHRGVDPALAVAIVSGFFTVLVPFVTKVAERIFAAEPKASMTLSNPEGRHEVVLQATLPTAVRNQLVEQALSSGAWRVRISLQSSE